MTDLIELIIIGIFLTPVILINIFLAIGALFQKLVTHFMQKIFDTEKEYKSSSRKVFSSVNLIIWIIVGGINVYFLDKPFSLGAIIVFLTFRSGYTLSKRIIFGFHDSRILKKKYKGNITKILSGLIKTGIIIEMIFLLLLAILYKYGIISTLLLSSRTPQFLSKNEIGIALLLSGETVKDKIDTKRKSFQNLFKR